MLKLDVLGNALLVLATIPAVLSVVVYSRVKWYRSAAGWHLMSYMVAIASVLVLGVCRIAFHDSTLFYALRVVAYIAIVIVLWWRLNFLIISHREYKESHDEH